MTVASTTIHSDSSCEGSAVQNSFTLPVLLLEFDDFAWIVLVTLYHLGNNLSLHPTDILGGEIK